MKFPKKKHETNKKGGGEKKDGLGIGPYIGEKRDK